MSGFSSSRFFRIWDYHCSHSRLLIRSLRDQSMPGSETIDLVFEGVFYLDTATEFDGLELEELNDCADEKMIKELSSTSGKDLRSGESYFLIHSAGKRSVIGAGHYVQVLINSLGRDESSLVAPDYPEMKPPPAILPGAKTILRIPGTQYGLLTHETASSRSEHKGDLKTGPDQRKS